MSIDGDKTRYQMINRMTEDSKKRLNFRYSLQDVYSIMDEKPPKYSGQASTSNSDDWAGGSYEQAREMSQYGDVKALGHLDKEAKKFFARVVTGHEGYGRKRVREYAGDTLDVGLHLSGEPRCMIDTVRQIKPNRLVRIITNCTASAFYGWEQLARRGAGIGALVRAIELRGYTTEITVGKFSSTSTGVRFYVPIKRFGEYVNPALIAYWLGNPTVLRRIMFRLMEEQPEEIVKRIGATGGYGSPSELDPDEIPVQTVYFKSINTYGDPSVEKWYDIGKQQLAEQGIIVQ